MPAPVSTTIDRPLPVRCIAVSRKLEFLGECNPQLL
jgi:hypothetical protein